jgi:hypothetical protein
MRAILKFAAALPMAAILCRFDDGNKGPAVRQTIGVAKSMSGVGHN